MGILAATMGILAATMGILQGGFKTHFKAVSEQIVDNLWITRLNPVVTWVGGLIVISHQLPVTSRQLRRKR